jgi:hypothetical protein
VFYVGFPLRDVLITMYIKSLSDEVTYQYIQLYLLSDSKMLISIKVDIMKDFKSQEAPASHL